MNAVKDFYDTTVQLIQLLENQQIKRDEKIEQIENLLAHREGLMEEIKPPFSQEEQKFGILLPELNQKLLKLLEQEKSVIQQDMILLKKQKENNKKYTNPYESLITVEGGFYDKRK
ncbi:flagellar protein FliT [Bacillus benzoevorans]|uniref:Flagellar protein FliT n=1 Tax=Bacillus benzoevorans TaxID=1456 RepID=A0A7X0HSX3_9BACI|nr:flagellar protein FliT [Bacillus benzoevorans]MBB6445130.1 flagellar protein FliT [Bacillus benzoevorans]